MTRIAQIIPYFGRWPEWIDLYMYSCGRNKMVDFIFFTDCECKCIHTPDNVIIHHITYDDYKTLVSERLGIDYNPESPYKLTDLKPFLGLVHQQELKNYDWWGFGDIDVVYGDLSMLINDKNLKKYNLITTHNYHIAGHCTFMRNNDYYRSLCLKIKDWQSRLSDSDHYGFDEAEWSNLVYPEIKWPLKLFSVLVRRINPAWFNGFMDKANSMINPKELFKEFMTSPVPKKREIYKYHPLSGRVTNPDNVELPYLHFLFFKKTPWLQTENYWRNGYYKLAGEIAGYEEIQIDIDKIKGK